MAPKAREDRPGSGDGKSKGRGGGKGGRGGRGGGKSAGDAVGAGANAAKRLQELDGASVEAESNFEILRAQRAAARSGRKSFQDIRENEGVDEDDPLNSIDDGIRLEPFNMRREMKEGHFDESGFYVMNKDEEKKVTDAWLDTVDQAERTATFKAAEKQKKAGDTAANRLSAMAKNLGPDSEGEDEDEDDDKEEETEDSKTKKEEGKEKAPDEAAKTEADEAKEAEQEQKEEENEIAMLEELISFLQPLENPAMALARLARGPASAGGNREAGGPLKTRAAMRKARAEAAKAQLPAAAQESVQGKQKKKRFNEWGYEEGGSGATVADMEADTQKTAEEAKPAEAAPAQAATESANGSEDSKAGEAAPEPEMAKAEAAKAAAAAAVAAEQAAAAEAAKAAAEKSTVTNAEAVARAAEKAAAEEKAVAEAAKAFAAETQRAQRSARNLAPEQGPEAAAMVNLNSEDTREVREKAMPKKPEEVPADGPARPVPGQRKKATDVGEAELERRKNIERLTDICDRLLERGVLVYDSSRELLAIDVRQRKGEKLTADEEADKAEAPEAKPETQSKRPAEKPAEVQYTNKRFKPSEGGGAPASVESVDSSSGAGNGNARSSSSSLLWQFRWGHDLDQVNGPFDSVTMHGWVTQGCFSDERPAEVRQCDADNKPQETCWHKWDKIDFELYI
eukprot:TRINITY_DN8823_c0_g1_i1.p1 TRINITY_DN8823_c0_g1~~TRINITY_DN8823_c0_g1_i1.p1  ORF type:complete len:695 (+),score=259.99 TRINITY_DN8823_c0_g1_i1:41-2086(+)